MFNIFSPLKNHQGFMKYFKNTSWLFFEKIFRMGVGLFVGIWVARYLGPDQFGLLNYVIAFVSLFGAIATLGLNGIIVRELVKDDTKRDILLGTAFWLKLIGGFFVLAVLAVAINFTSNDHYTNILIFIIASAVIFQSFNVVDLYFQSKVLSKFVVYANLIGLIISSIIKIVLILNEAPLIYFAFVILFDSIVLAFGHLYIYFYNHLDIRLWKFDPQKAKELLKDSWPLIITGLAIMLQSRIDQVMLKEMIGSYEVGQYSVAMRMIEVFDFLPMIVAQSLMPAIANAKKNNETLYQERLYTLYKLMMIFFLLTASFVFIFGENIILLLYGSEYILASTLLPLFAIRTLFTNYGVARGLFITNNNLFKISMIFVISSSTINVILNYLLIPVFQSKGALLATIISFTLFVFVFNFFHKDTRYNGLLMLKSMVTFFTLKIKDIK